MKKIIPFYWLSFILFSIVSCNEQIEAEKKQDVLSETTIPLINRVLDYNAVENGDLKSGKLIDEVQQAQLSLSKIDPAKKEINSYPGIQYFCLDTIAHNNYGTALLISRLYEMEDFVWLVIYDSEMKLKDFKTVFYDEYAESAHHIYAQFKDPIITLSKYTMNLEDGSEKTDTLSFSISNKLTFSKDLLKQQEQR